nr:hypothetical protein [Spirochaetaceae bacterium]
PKLSIKSIAYRLKGTYFSTSSSIDSIEKKTLSQEEKRVLEQSSPKSDLPDELKERFEKLKQSMLDKE